MDDVRREKRMILDEEVRLKALTSLEKKGIIITSPSVCSNVSGKFMGLFSIINNHAGANTVGIKKAW